MADLVARRTLLMKTLRQRKSCCWPILLPRRWVRLQNLRAAEADAASAEVARLRAEEARSRADVAFDAQVRASATTPLYLLTADLRAISSGVGSAQRANLHCITHRPSRNNMNVRFCFALGSNAAFLHRASVPLTQTQACSLTCLSTSCIL